MMPCIALHLQSGRQYNRQKKMDRELMERRKRLKSTDSATNSSHSTSTKNSQNQQNQGNVPPSTQATPSSLSTSTQMTPVTGHKRSFQESVHENQPMNQMMYFDQVTPHGMNGMNGINTINTVNGVSNVLLHPPPPTTVPSHVTTHSVLPQGVPPGTQPPGVPPQQSLLQMPLPQFPQISQSIPLMSFPHSITSNTVNTVNTVNTMTPYYRSASAPDIPFMLSQMHPGHPQAHPQAHPQGHPLPLHTDSGGTGPPLPKRIRLDSDQMDQDCEGQSPRHREAFGDDLNYSQHSQEHDHDAPSKQLLIPSSHGMNVMIP